MSTATLRTIVRGLDRPAVRAAELASRSLFASLAPGLVGLGATALAISAASYFEPARPTRLDALRPFLETVAVAIPSAAIAASFLDLKLSLRRILAAAGLGLLAGGIVALSVLPLVAYIGLASEGVALAAFWSPASLAGGVALGGLGATVCRVFDAFDDRPNAALVSRLFVISTFALFGIRVFQVLGR